MSRAQRGPVPPPVASTSRAILPPKKPRRALTLASTSSLAQSYDGEATGGGTTTTALGQTSRKKRKKLTHVREELDQPPSSSSSSSSSSPEPADVGEGHDEKDMTDPRNLPANGHGRKRRALKGLEFGMYHSALRDSVEGECDLGRVLCDWEGMRRERERVEKREEEDKVPVDPTLDPSLVAESEADERRGRRDDGPHRLPGSLLLTQIARWPLVPSLCPPGPAIDDTIETLQDVANYNRRKLAAPGKKVRKRLRSAYEPNAPLALPPKTPRSAGSNDSFSPSSSSSSDDSPCESEEEDDLHSDLDPLTPLLLPLLDELLLRLSTYIPRSPFPAENPTAFKARPDRTRRGEGVGWEKVWYGARDMGMSKAVTDKLRMRMEEVYGPAQLTQKRVPRKEGPPTKQALGYTFDSLMSAFPPSQRSARRTPSNPRASRLRKKPVVRPPPRPRRKNEDEREYMKNVEAEWVAQDVRVELLKREERRREKAEKKGVKYVEEGGGNEGREKGGGEDSEEEEEEEEEVQEEEVSGEESEESEDADESD